MKSRDNMPVGLRKGKVPFIIGMLSIAVINFIIFYVAVNVKSILMAFTRVSYDENWQEVSVFSLYNFEQFFKSFAVKNDVMIEALSNTLKYFLINVVVLIPASFVISYVLYRKIWFNNFFRVIFFLPSIVSAVVLSTFFKVMIQQYGPIYELLLNLFGYKMPSLLSQESTATNTIIAYCIWTGLGGNMIIYLAAMTRLPEELLEPARIDGITPVQEMLKIVFPLTWSTVSTTLILAFTSIFTASGPILLFTRGSAGTYTISYWIYEQVYIIGKNYEYSSAMGLMYALFGLPIIILARWGFGKIYADVEY